MFGGDIKLEYKKEKIIFESTDSKVNFNTVKNYIFKKSQDAIDD